MMRLILSKIQPGCARKNLKFIHFLIDTEYLSQMLTIVTKKKQRDANNFFSILSCYLSRNDITLLISLVWCGCVHNQREAFTGFAKNVFSFSYYLNRNDITLLISLVLCAQSKRRLALVSTKSSTRRSQLGIELDTASIWEKNLLRTFLVMRFSSSM